MLSCTLLSFHFTSLAQEAGGKLYVSPMISAGITAGHDARKGLGVDFSNPNRMVGLEVRGGCWLSNNLSIFTGFGYGSYHIRMVERASEAGPDTIRTQSQEYWEVPIALRWSSYYGVRSVRTRFYAAAGFKACFLNDARYDYTTTDKTASGVNIVRQKDFNPFWLRGFIEGGLDIPMDYGSAILVGLNVSSGLSRDASIDGALSKDNPSIVTIGGSIGLRIGLTPYKIVQPRRQQRGQYKSGPVRTQYRGR
jgi:hypothetical protein